MKKLDPNTASLEEMLRDLSNRCHEGVSLEFTLHGCDLDASGWEASVCSKSSRGNEINSKNKYSFFNGPLEASPIEAVRELYKIYVDENGAGIC